ncbi:MAG: endonuclease/exonuclease/phosphatase family protein [Parafilimonas sp.]
MKIITWNCNMAFRNKANLILKYSPDILIIPECEHPQKLVFKNKELNPTDTLWFGQNQNKGLGIFSYSDFSFKVLDVHNENFKMIIPVEVSNKNFRSNLFAVWANNPKDIDGHYITQVWKALHYYDAIITGNKTILIGDFNSNTIWDKPRRAGNHSTVVKKLEEKKIYSVYHKHFNQIQGKEKHPTLYMYRHKDKPYHIDYCFASSDMLQYLKLVEVGKHRSWRNYSDHVPLIVTFDKALYNSSL